jgi:murein DD-endopeptidase MepM/ murein hydrolase activator NlpD
LNKRAEAMETWLEGDAAAPRSNNMRGYLRAKELLADDSLSSDEVQSELDSARQEQKAAVDRLGQDNTEISWWQSQAETLAGQVGGARARALSVNGRLADLQKQGADLAARVQDEFQALRSAGYPVGVAKIVAAGPEAGPEPIPEPVDWPSSAPAYALPVGKTAASVLAGSPLFTTKDRLFATGVVGDPSNWQAPLRGVVTTPFGDGTPYQDAHYALDIGAHLYAPIVAAADGVVEYAGLAASDNRLASYGLVVMIRHNEHATSLYAHMDDRANGLAVNVGDHVSKGQLIGYVGLTGYSTGPHLHFEVRIDGQPIDPTLLVNPQP